MIVPFNGLGALGLVPSGILSAAVAKKLGPGGSLSAPGALTPAAQAGALNYLAAHPVPGTAPTDSYVFPTGMSTTAKVLIGLGLVGAAFVGYRHFHKVAT